MTYQASKKTDFTVDLLVGRALLVTTYNYYNGIMYWLCHAIAPLKGSINLSVAIIKESTEN